MNWPALKVEVAFGTDGNDQAAVNAMTSASWIDITEWVRAAPTVERSSRSTELDRFQAGTVKLTLDNNDGRFTPLNSSSPYFPNVLPYRMIRITATWNGTPYQQWQGYVERWPMTWADPARGLVLLECVDAMATAAQIDMSGIYTSEVLADAPPYYYPLTDESGAAQAANASTTLQQAAVPFHNSQALGSSDSCAFGGQMPIVGADTQQGLALATTVDGSGNVSGYGLRLPFVSWSWSSWSWEFWFVADAGNTGAMLDVYDAGSTKNYALSVALDAGGRVSIIVSTPDGHATGTLETAGGFDDGKAHHVVVTWASPVPKLYVDGGYWSLVTLTGSTFTGIRNHLVQLGNADTIGSGIPNKNRGGAFDGVLGQVAFYPQTLSASRVSAHYIAGRSPLAGQLPGQRAASLLRYADFPLWNVYTGATVLQSAIDIAGRSLLDCLQDLADTENSELYADAVGQLTLTYRGIRMDQTAPAVTFGSNVAAGEIPYALEGLQLDFDPNLVFNDVTVERKNGSSPRVYDSDSILNFFDRALSRTSYAASDTDSQAAAAWLLDRYRQPQIRSEKLTIAAGSLAADVINPWPQLLSLDIGDRVLINHRPMNQPAITIPGFVDQIAHAIDPDAGSWTITLQVSPLFHDYFALADPAVPTWDAASTPDADGYIYLSF